MSGNWNDDNAFSIHNERFGPFYSMSVEIELTTKSIGKTQTEFGMIGMKNDREPTRIMTFYCQSCNVFKNATLILAIKTKQTTAI